tara:strand:- start:3916 stop:4188 length:273 start_codon:yes stop_codon:yes gene_type:complete
MPEVKNIEPPDLFQVMVDGEAFGNPMPISDAHNYALGLRSISPNHKYDVVERYNFFCKKCGEDFWTSDYLYWEKIHQSRWRCDSCVWDLL